MRKSFKYYLLIWTVALALFLAIIFMIPTSIDGRTVIQLVSLVSTKNATIMALSGVGELIFTKYGGAFWPCFLLIIVAYLINLFSAHIAFKEEDNQKFFYNVPLIKVSYAGLAATLLFGTISMFFPDCPIWVGLGGCSIIILMTIIAVVKARALANIVSDKDERIKTSTFVMKELTSIAETNYKNEKDASKKEELKKIYEALRYSDPVSSETTKELEKKIKENITKADVVLDLINQRNIICKNSK